MSEDEAKTKWCPHAVASHTDPRCKRQYDDAGTLLPAPVFLHNCLGSACMAWRWLAGPRGRPENSIEFIEAIRDHRAAHNSTLKTAKEAVEAGWRPGGPQLSTSGFCGLAGRPS